MHFTALLAILPLGSALVVRSGGLTNIDAADGRYVVKIKGDSTNVDKVIKSVSANTDHLYNHVFNGWAGKLTADQVKKLQHHPDIEAVEVDDFFKANYAEGESFSYEEGLPDGEEYGKTSTGQSTEFAPWMASSKKRAVQKKAPWNLARISNKKAGKNTYTYDKAAGTGTCVYVLDSGIETTHPGFQGRAKFLKNFVDGSDSDEAGHGTHVAGIIGSSNYGVAKNTTLYAVKVTDAGRGLKSDLIAALDFVVKDAPTRACPKGVVVNISNGGFFSRLVNDAARKVFRAGYFVAAAAGNAELPAMKFSPASETTVCTVGAIDQKDAFADYSNYGPAVKVLAPGTNVTSLWRGGGIKVASGTSMASPHVAGLGAYYLSFAVEKIDLCNYITQTALKGVVKMGARTDTPNLLINNRKL
ncbi:hypothetical protein QQS21_010614 [Conoideocrella luteorostrata]|uniref:Uncharacterized protein n=1 Tax=Conoideocrella luteorostrata TaxID=1105319 RepID=A0AAJ0FP97_9HYPO|nr:hypothetical protein QQS21_010614 [Conoideocrella luteorostrata]